MSKKQWMVLLMLFLTYLLLGASIFYHIESRLETERRARAKTEQIEINALLQEHYVPSREHDHDEILGKLTRYCGKSVYNYTEGKTDPLKWDFYNSFYFAYTVVSTIGYGNLAPTNMLGRILMIFYGLIGIPMNGILLTQLGEFFGHAFVKAHQKYKSYKHGRNDYSPRKLTPFETRKVGLAAQIFVYLTPGFVMFIFFPAFLFSHYEGWSYDEAVYYAFVTLTTIGFGDYVAGQDNRKGSGFFFVLYKIFLICWISFGLGYIVMIMTFIARGMRSKKITRIEHKLAINLKHTQSKIWNEFNKEIHYLRRVFNELQLSKVKRVYVDECDYEVPPSKLPHSNSFPDLRELMYGNANVDATENIPAQRPRRRANSEVVPTDDQIARVVSETDLQRIDKTATFAAHAMVQPAELLARLVNILGYIPPDSEDVVEDSTTAQEIEEIRGRTTEGTPEPVEKIPDGSEANWTIGNERIPRFLKPRSRATSEIRLHESKTEDRNVEWTWSGPTATSKIQELMKARVTELKQSPKDKNKDTKDAKLSKYRTLALAKVPRPWKLSSSEKKSSSEVENKDARQGWFDDRRRDSNCSISRRHYYYTHTGAAAIQPSATQEGSNLLEETSLADFLRALSLLHASVGTVDEQLTIGRTRPKRKMGTACLSPPKLPSLFTLFSSQSSAVNSNQSTITRQPNRPSLVTRRGSLAFMPVAYPAAKPRRFSLRPVPTPISPPTPPLSNSRRQQPSEDIIKRAPFVFESPKEPLIKMEGPPATSSPMKPLPNPRRFSLRPTQNQNQNGIPSTAGIPSKVPRWKAGMLQRQIGQMNLRRRVRAFSLSDVEASRNESNVDPDSGPKASIRKSVVGHASIPKSREEAKTVRLVCHAFEDGSSATQEESLVEIRIEKPNAERDNRNDNNLEPKESKNEKSDTSHPTNGQEA